VTELVTNGAIGPVVDIDQPLDFAVALVGDASRPRVAAAVSAAVKDPEGARALLAERYKLVPAENGATIVQGLGRTSRKGEGDDDDDDAAAGFGPEADRTCELAPAYGSAPVRMVCGFSPRAIAELGPWLTRTATRATSTSDLHVEFRETPLHAIVSQQKRFLALALSGVLGGFADAPSVRELLTSAATDAADFVLDLDSASLEVLLGDTGASASVALKTASATSAIARLATAHPERGGPAPAALWQMPADADFAVFQRGVDEADMARGRDRVFKAAAEVLAKEGVKEEDRKALLEALGEFPFSAPLVYASGVDAAAAKKALAAGKPLGYQADRAERLEAARVSTEALLGWRLLALDDGAGKMPAAMKRLVAAWARPGLAAALRARNKDGAPPTLRAAPIAKGVSVVPTGSAHYVLQVALQPPGRADAGKPKPGEKKAAAAKPLTLHVFVVADGTRSWLATGADEMLVASKLSSALAQGGDKLAARSELASFKAGPVGAGGFVTLRGLGESAALGDVADGSFSAAFGDFDTPAQMSDQGLVPIPFSFTTQAGASPVSVASLQVPRAAIEDLVAVILHRGGF
jgi:hypothetical protein